MRLPDTGHRVIGGEPKVDVPSATSEPQAALCLGWQPPRDALATVGGGKMSTGRQAG
jgi:hypothetical protein